LARTTVHSDDQLLFVYGALMNPAERLRLLGRPIEAIPASLPGYYRGQKRYHFVVRRAGTITNGAILEGLGEHDLVILDAYEEVPLLYTRDRIEVLAADARPIESWIYLPTEWARES
jgi:Gamma-glutamyl cyclotransferase, AIG2-like